MQDESPWKPPTEVGPTPAAPAAPAAPPMPAPSLPDAAPSAPTLPEPALPAPSEVSPWAPGGAGAAPPAPPAPMPPNPAAPPGPPVIDGPIVDPVVASERPRRSKWLVGGAVAAVLAVGGAGVFAVSNLTGQTVGGSETPDELGADLLAAIENEDVLGVIDVLLPGERASLGEPFVAVVSELQRLEVLAETDLSQIAGLDIELSGEDVSVRPTNVDDIVNVDMRADVVVSIDGADLPIGDLITDNLPEDALTELRGSRITETDRLDIWLTAVEQDDRWYFSLLHSVAEVARAEGAPGSEIPFEGVGADGAESPEAAVDQVLDRVEAIDLTGLIRSLNPGEAAALQRYAPLFLEDAEAVLDEVPLRWQITEREIRVEGSGDTRTAFVDALAIEGDLEGSVFSFGFADGCVRASLDGEQIEQCTDGDVLGADGIEELFGEQPELVELFDAIEAAFADVEPAGIEIRQHDGEWYVSPIGTVSEAFLKILRALDREELDRIIDAFEVAFSSLEEAVFDSMNDLAGGGFTVDDGDLVLTDPPQIDGDVDGGFDGDIEIGMPENDGWFECYELLDAADATACFESYVASGDIDREMMPVVLRYPECGYAELAWTNEVYSLPDDEFIAAAEAARSCFLPLVEAGEISPYELPSEVTRLECYEGRNWYQVFDDPEYDDRYYECISAGYEG